MKIIDEELVAVVVKELADSLRGRVRIIRAEIQDCGYFILIRIEQDSSEIAETCEIINCAKSIMNRLIDKREDDYSWMINMEYRGALLDSEIGGQI
jgi:hypothetical protein